MTACAHVGSAVRIATVDLEQLKISDNSFYSPKHRATSSSNDCNEVDSHWNCVSCGTTEHPWLCLSCGLIHCGRYANGDGLAHFKHHEEHAISMHCFEYGVYCYKCDDFVGDDTADKKIKSIRNSLRVHNKNRTELSFPGVYREGSEGIEEIYTSETESDSPSFEGTEEEDSARPDSATSSRLLPAIQEDASVPEDPAPPEHPALLGGRVLRPRKRKEETPMLEFAVGGKRPPSSTAIHHHGVKAVVHPPPHVDRIRGLRNLGNTCFMNAVLQALNSIPVLREFLVSLPLLEAEQDRQAQTNVVSPRYKTRRFLHSGEHGANFEGSSTVLAEELRKCLIALSDGTALSTAFGPDALFHAVWQLSARFAGYQQQDSHEFLRYMLDRLHSDLRKCRIPDGCASHVVQLCGVDYAPGSSAVSLIFEGALQSQVTCIECGTMSNKQDPFLDLSLDIHTPVVAGQRAPDVDLMSCVKRFFEKEELEQCEQYMCGRCQSRQPSTKQLFIRVMPKVLCLHLKRFRWSNFSRGKLDNMVHFPLRGLDMGKFLAPKSGRGGNGRSSPAIFDLSSIVVHHGSGVSSGHYTAYGHRGGEWFHFNDSSVKGVTPEMVLKQKAYLLFYTRTN